MDTNENDHFEQEKRNEELLSYDPANLSSDWRFNGSNLTNSSFSNVNPVPIYKGIPMEASSSSSHPMIDSLGTTIWDHPMNNPNLVFCDMNSLNASTNSNNMDWQPPSSMVKGNMFLPPGRGLFPQGLSQFPADSGFIERAARFSCFGRGNFSDLVNPYGVLEGANPNPYPIGSNSMMMQQPQGALVRNDLNLKSVSGEKSPNKDVTVDLSKNVSLSGDKIERSPMKNEGNSNSFGQSHHEAELSCGGSIGGEPSSSKALGSNKRKRGDQSTKLSQNEGISQPAGDISKNNTEAQQKVDQKSTSTSKANNGKQGSQASDSPKEDYIHVRARRGQATNSHSLAERVRREKISERMKFLQDLVPGCSKVTGKAVMLDEIINYVQSLQRQVEFLSMKLATVNPRLDFDLDSVLAKEILQPRVGPSSSLGYSPNMSTMAFPPLLPSQAGFVQPCHPGAATSSDALRMSINSQLTAMSEGYKHPTQVPNMWVEDELHNVVQMGLNSSIPLDDTQDLNGSSSQSHMKVEL